MTLSNRSNIHSKWKLTKIIFKLRMVLILGILTLFYLRFLLMENAVKNFDENENSWIETRYSRKILSVDYWPHESNVGNCTPPAILEFPSDGLTRDQRIHGWIILHILVVFYGFWFLAAICDDYMVPSIEQICSNFKIDEDVIGATIMAAAVSSPELFMNFVGTFITKGDIGVSAIVGSAVFNILAVPACCGLFALSYLKLDWWPITRDCVVYLLAVLTLLGILRDGKVMWYEAIGLIVAYFVYMLMMYHNRKISQTAKKLLLKCGLHTAQYREVTEFTPLLTKNESKFSLATEAYVSLERGLHSSHLMLYLEQQEKQENIRSPWSCEGYSKVEFIFRWPITFILWSTVPNCRQRNALRYLTFVLAIVWTGIMSYVVAFAITIIGDTLHIPDSVLGLTILAAGVSIPEAICSIIVTRQGQASKGLSNSLGSNTFDILLCLGLPWFVKSYFLPDNPQEFSIILNAEGLTFTGVALLTSLLALYLIFALNKFTLNRRVGLTCLVLYIVIITLTTLMQLNVFFPVNLPVCPH
ncbi:sodium/potassium/calcium exchanger 4-like [Musca domestica]|uniref:Sodium/potassium/calcium exchanger 4-like n=1 Tax=Musca domestica TaxID=7370 RepID=A0A1I8MXX2_MUSDO|nr:sodium/potassium/calcium exchanger 4-like [Musca domestica]XP_058978534.1 sodium/potassium/calcium exchanger 4-like [Musca domestica]